MHSAKLTIRKLVGRPVDVPLRRPLQTAGGLVKSAPLVLIDLQTDEGITGSSYVFCYTTIALKPVAELLRNLEDLVRGESVAPSLLGQKLLARFRLLGPQGLTGIAMAGIDMAAWDAVAKASNMPLVRLLSGEPRPIPAYNSCGLGLIGPERAALEARELLDGGFRAIKIRLGYPDLETDVRAVRCVRDAVGAGILLMCDYNQCLSVPEAIRRIPALEEEVQLAWMEEPTRADDYVGHATIRQVVKTPIQIGENWWGPHDMVKAVAAGASDFAMPDATKIGGVTGWLRAASLAEAHGLPLSSHLFPEISAHLLAVSPTCDWLEYVDFANPILLEPARVEKGHVVIDETPGFGLAWDEDAVKRFLLD
jgi:mandelate racemase